ncbi:MAG: Nif11-like leader peptide family natural product precursor [Deltaproteobacteria bacterium]|nr:Nif11-like leader peptide family natural product precursor [Deltaproteobacteria bacterium]
MASLTVREFMTKVAEDGAFRKQVGITETMTISEFRAKAAAAGHDYTEAELISESRSLSDAELDGVAGGVATDAHALRAVADPGGEAQIRATGGDLMIRATGGDLMIRAGQTGQIKQ